MTMILLLLPFISGLVILLLRNKLLSLFLLFGNAIVYFLITLLLFFGIQLKIPGLPFSNYFELDDLGLFFLLILALVFLACTLYTLFYFKEKQMDTRRESIYSAVFLFFLTSMTGVILSSHLALLWVFIEATTLTSAVLIYFEKKKSSLEAAWKYIFICSVGIALSFVGIIFLSIGSKAFGSLFFKDLYDSAGQIRPFWLKMSFAFILVGFGTKIGVAPMHAWLPDAHSEAPSPVSALLSGTLLNTALLGLLRVYKILNLGNLSQFAQFLLILVGLLSILISAAFMLKVKNYKRLLAYSSIENMGIIFLGIGAGGAGIFAALLHTAAHSLAKTSLFLTSGNIFHLYKTKEINEVNGLLNKNPGTGWLWIISLLAISGFPPFPIFLTKFLLIKALLQNGLSWLVLPLFLLLLTVLLGMGKSVFAMVFGEVHGKREHGSLNVFSFLPQITMIIILITIGIHLPERLLLLLNQATFFLK